MQHKSAGESRIAEGRNASEVSSACDDLGATPRLIAIASGKGGVGKTWLTLTLAQALSARRARPLVFDADFGLANADIQIGHPASVDLRTILCGDADLREGIVPVSGGGFDILSGVAGSGILGDIDDAAIDRLVARLLAAHLPHDHVLFDLGTGVEPAARQLAAMADTVILVTTEEPTSLTDGYAVLKLLQRDCAEHGKAIDVRIVVNQAASERSGRRTHAALARAARGFLRLDPPLLGLVLRDDNVVEATRAQRLFLSAFPKSSAACAVQLIARRLLTRQRPPSSGPDEIERKSGRRG